MTIPLARTTALRKRSWLLAASLFLLTCLAYGMLVARPTAVAQTAAEPVEATTEQVHRLCAACHPYPPAETFPRSAWRKEVKQGYDFFHKDLTYRFDYPSLESVVRYYEKRAPEALASLPRPDTSRPLPFRFERGEQRPPDAERSPGIAHANLVHLFHKDKLDILACDAVSNQVVVLSPYETPPAWKVLVRGLSCVRAEVVDLDGDGINDVILAAIGSFYATDDRVGSVVWLRGAKDGTFTPITLLDGIGRVADVQAADFTGDGKLDLVVAVFGWHETGEILLLENQTTDYAKPQFKSRVLDARHGTSHVPVADLNKDGKPDFVALISQEHETVIAFINEGSGRFRRETIYAAPHPGFGYNGIQLVDLDGDGDMDALVSNGDSLDSPYLLKPYHGVTWLENTGSYPFTPHRLVDCCGAGSPVAADFDGDGRLDIAYGTFLPAEFFPQRVQLGLESVGVLHQIAPGRFERYTLETANCDHLTCAVGDLDGDGRPELVIGNYSRIGRPGGTLTIWRNTTEKRPAAGRGTP